MSFARKTASDFFKDEEPSVETAKIEELKDTKLNKEEDRNILLNEKLEEIEIENETKSLKKTKVKVSLDYAKDKGKEQGVEQSSFSTTEALKNSNFYGYTSYPHNQTQTLNTSHLTSQLTPDQVQYQQQYMQQCQQYNEHYQQYQQYYAQYYNQSVPLPPTIPIPSSSTSDPAYEFFTTSTTPSSTSYDSTRASRQLTSYFDPTKFHSVLSPEMQALQQTQKHQQQAKLTGKEIEAFKKRKIEKKKAKNKWLYE